MRTPLLLLCLATVAAGCGSSDKTITVMGRTLKVVEQNYGTAGDVTDSSGVNLFCPPLVAKQFEVIITDFAFCAGASKKQSNASLFHSTDEYNLRLITPGPSLLKKNPNGTFMTNVFPVGNTGGCSSAPGGVKTAAAFFSHGSGGSLKYDLNLEASDGNISITAYDGQSDLQGTFDLVFAGEHVLGTFEATYCPGLASTYGL
jgi:hypothetical protein